MEWNFPSNAHKGQKQFLWFKSRIVLKPLLSEAQKANRISFHPLIIASVWQPKLPTTYTTQSEPKPLFKPSRQRQNPHQKAAGIHIETVPNHPVTRRSPPPSATAVPDIWRHETKHRMAATNRHHIAAEHGFGAPGTGCKCAPFPAAWEPAIVWSSSPDHEPYEGSFTQLHKIPESLSKFTQKIDSHREKKVKFQRCVIFSHWKAVNLHKVCVNFW